MLRKMILVLFAASQLPALAQTDDYDLPRTEYGQPDLQGHWFTETSTMMERLGEGELVVSAEVAAGISAGVRGFFTEGNTDPQFIWEDPLPLSRVNGEFRSSLITSPIDGKMPFSEAGVEMAQRYAEESVNGFDGPEQRTLSDRCLNGVFVTPPFHTMPIPVPREIIQTRDHVLIYTEDVDGLRIVRLQAAGPSPAIQSFAGYSVGQWQNDTLVVRTTDFRHDFPARFGIPMPMLVGPATIVEERFTRLSEDRLHYEFQVNDPELYMQPWRGEFLMHRKNLNIYNYECHEGNYSMPAMLRGGIVDRLNKAQQ